MANTKEATIVFDLDEVVNEIESHYEPVYNVIMHNDDYTPMDYVVLVLVTIFDMDPQQAFSTMMHIHHHGKAIVKTDDKSICEELKSQVDKMNEMSGVQLKVTVEKA